MSESTCAVQQIGYRIVKNGKRDFDGAPYRQVINRSITMNQQVAKSDNLRRIGNLFGPKRLYFAELINGLPYDFELALNGGTQSPVPCVVVESFAFYKLQYGCGSLTRIPKIGARITPHRRPRSFDKCLRANRGCAMRKLQPGRRLGRVFAPSRTGKRKSPSTNDFLLKAKIPLKSPHHSRLQSRQRARQNQIPPNAAQGNACKDRLSPLGGF
jgi:hypothetical protein